MSILGSTELRSLSRCIAYPLLPSTAPKSGWCKPLLYSLRFHGSASWLSGALALSRPFLQPRTCAAPRDGWAQNALPHVSAGQPGRGKLRPIPAVVSGLQTAKRGASVGGKEPEWKEPCLKGFQGRWKSRGFWRREAWGAPKSEFSSLRSLVSPELHNREGSKGRGRRDPGDLESWVNSTSAGRHGVWVRVSPSSEAGHSLPTETLGETRLTAKRTKRCSNQGETEIDLS